MPAAAQKKLAAAYMSAKLLLLHKEKLAELSGAGDAHHVRDLLDGKTVVFEPKAVHEKVDMPRVIIAVIVVCVLLGLAPRRHYQGAKIP